MTLPLSRFALALALAATAALGVVAQTPDESTVDGAAADAQQAAETAAQAVADVAPPADPVPPADAVADPAVDAEAAADVPADPVTDATSKAAPELSEGQDVYFPAGATAPVAEPHSDAAIETAAEPAEASVVVTPAEPALVVEPAPSVVVEAAPAPAGPVCCPLNVVDYRTTLSAKRAYRCYGPGVNTAVCIDNPADCTCTQYQVSLCVPACCTGAPRVCPSTGLFGRGKVDLVWDCGFTATVVFRAHGGAVVIYQG